MPETDATDEGGEEKMNLRLPASLLADVDERWREEGYSSRSEFVREALRDAVYGPRLSRRALTDLAVSGKQFAEDETVSADAARKRFGDDGTD